MSSIIVGIPCYSGASDLLLACLQAVRDRSGNNIEYDLVVVDDSGNVEHQRKSKEVCDKFNARWLCNDVNKGVAASWNVLSRSSDAPYIALLNDDLIVAQGWLDALYYALHNNPQAGSFGLFAYFITMEDLPTLLSSPTATVMPRDPFSKQPAPEELQKHHGRENLGRVMCPTGCGFGFRRDVYEKTIGFDETLGKCFHEETDFGTQCAALGYPSYCLQWPMNYHIWSATFGRSPELMVNRPMDYSRNRYVEKWGALPQAMHVPLMSKIPFQQLKWLDGDGVFRDEIITAEEGFYEEK
jgi:GT2 family glycosyltransferase